MNIYWLKPTKTKVVIVAILFAIYLVGMFVLFYFAKMYSAASCLLGSCPPGQKLYEAWWWPQPCSMCMSVAQIIFANVKFYVVSLLVIYFIVCIPSMFRRTSPTLRS